MANPNKPRGFVPVMTLSGSPWQGMVRMIQIPADFATGVFRGDMLTIASDDTATKLGVAQYPVVEAAAAGSAYYGVYLGPLVNRAISQTEAPGYSPTSTATYGLAVVGIDVVYEIQEDNVGNDLALTDIGSVGDLVAGAGSTTTGVSGHLLDSSDVRANTSGHGLQLVALAPKINNDVGTYAKWLVRINRSQWKFAL